MLKRRVRDCIDPERGLGHVDGVKATVASTSTSRAEGHEDARSKEGEGKSGEKNGNGDGGEGGDGRAGEGTDAADERDRRDAQGGRDGKDKRDVGRVVGRCADCG